MNFIDFMAILPVFLTMILEGLEDMRVIYYHENYDIARAMSSSRADPVLSHCPNWGYLNI